MRASPRRSEAVGLDYGDSQSTASAHTRIVCYENYFLAIKSLILPILPLNGVRESECAEIHTFANDQK
jgi:hypothetical protein